MIFKIINNNCYRLNIFEIKKISDITKDIKKIITNNLIFYLKKFKIFGDVKLDIYTNKYYGTIINIKRFKATNDKDSVQLHITYHFNNHILYKVDYFELLEYINVKNQTLYYYSNSYYLNITNNIKHNDFLKLLEISDIVFDDYFDILNKGLKIYI